MFPKTFESYWSRIYWHHSPHHTTISPPWFVVDSPRDRFVFPLIGQVQPRVFQLEIYWNSSDKTMRYHQHHQHNNHNLSLIIGILSTEKLTASLFFYWLTSRLLSLYVYCWDWFLRFPHTMNHRGECNLAGVVEETRLPSYTIYTESNLLLVQRFLALLKQRIPGDTESPPINCFIHWTDYVN